nr:urease accessory protein UreD [Saccharopolyspora sp. HNM0983]
MLTVELGADGRSVLRDLRSQPPLTLLPQRRRTSRSDGAAVVHLVGSATSPLGGDRVRLRVQVGRGARLRLRGTAATVALPDPHGRPSSAAVEIDVAPGGTVEYLPEATVVSARAEHAARLAVRLGAGARMRCRETLVLGRRGERPGTLVSTTELSRAGVPLLRQRLDLGDRWLDATPPHRAGARVLATETLVWDADPRAAAGGDGWALTPLAAGGAQATALAPDAVTAQRRLRLAVGAHPDAADLL